MDYVDTTELLILADGRILVHNLTPAFAQVLADLNAEDELMQQRANASDSNRPPLPKPAIPNPGIRPRELQPANAGTPNPTPHGKQHTPPDRRPDAANL